jgi:hypothetical protein
MLKSTTAGLGALLAALMLVFAPPAEASNNGTVVSHGFTHTEFFPEDICGPRASSVTFTAKMAQWQYVERADGTWSWRDVSQVTYEVDFVDPALVDYSARLTEVNHYIMTPGDTFIVSNTYHDFGGGLKIWERLNIKDVKGDVVVDRGILKVTGCP